MSEYSALSATTSARSCCSTARNWLASICRTEQRAGRGDRTEMVDRLEQHLEQHGTGPAEHQNAVHRGHRAEELPRLHRRNVAITERGVVDEGEIQQIAARGCR